jgi:cytochrome c-type biogenesis protein
VLAVLGAVLAGALTTLAPCVLPLLPVIVGGSAMPASASLPTGGSRPMTPTAVRRTAVPTRDADLRRAVLITGALGASVIAFTLLLRATTALIGVPPAVWQWVSGGLLIVLGWMALFPNQWDWVSSRLGLQARSTARLADARGHEGAAGAILTGVALGPVFTSCSPLYGYVIVTVLPSEVVYGLVLLVAYTLGLCLTLLAVAVAGQGLVRRLGWAADPHGRFRRGLGAAFVVVGLMVATGLMKDLETWLVQSSPWRPWELDSGFIPR